MTVLYIRRSLSVLVRRYIELPFFLKWLFGWACRLKAIFIPFRHQKEATDDQKSKIPQFADWVPSVPYLEIIESHSGIEVYRGEGKFWVKGQAVSTLIKARALARAISNNAEWSAGDRRSPKVKRV